jgi:hypothetical protein
MPSFQGSQARAILTHAESISSSWWDCLKHSFLLFGLWGTSAVIEVNHLLGLPLNAATLLGTFYLYWAAYLSDHLKDCR